MGKGLDLIVNQDETSCALLLFSISPFLLITDIKKLSCISLLLRNKDDIESNLYNDRGYPKSDKASYRYVSDGIVSVWEPPSIVVPFGVCPNLMLASSQSAFSRIS